jgi:putative ABC transport system substrate-binding protein
MAQVAAKRPLVAVLSSVTSIAAAHLLSGFRQGLQELGYVEGRNIDIAYRYADGDLSRMQGLANELVQLTPEVIVTSGSGILAIKQTSATIPIVSPSLVDPENFGFVTSIARPDGQVTGILLTLDSLPAKQLQLVIEVVPAARNIGLLFNLNNPSHAIYRRNAESAAASFARDLVPVDVSVPDDLDPAFQKFARERIELVLVLPDPVVFTSESRRVAALAISARLPTMYGFKENVEDGGLMSYGIDLRESFRQAAVYVDKILKGAKPGELPVELPTKFELVINLKTAKALGITFPPSIMVQADELIERDGKSVARGER